MRGVFADTFFWTALANPKDSWHERARAMRASLADARLVTTDEVLVEFAASLGGQAPHLRAVVVGHIWQILNDPNIHVVPQSRESFLSGLELFEARPDKSYSLTDCISMQTMKTRRIAEALTEDRHFVQEGFQILFEE